MNKRIPRNALLCIIPILITIVAIGLCYFEKKLTQTEIHVQGDGWLIFFDERKPIACDVRITGLVLRAPFSERGDRFITEARGYAIKDGGIFINDERVDTYAPVSASFLQYSADGYSWSIQFPDETAEILNEELDVFVGYYYFIEETGRVVNYDVGPRCLIVFPARNQKEAQEVFASLSAAGVPENFLRWIQNPLEQKLPD